MPIFEISLDVYQKGKRLETKNYRNTRIETKNPNYNFTVRDYEAACAKIRKMMLHYNKGFRGGKLAYTDKNGNCSNGN